MLKRLGSLIGEIYDEKLINKIYDCFGYEVNIRQVVGKCAYYEKYGRCKCLEVYEDNYDTFYEIYYNNNKDNMIVGVNEEKV